jgi:hypothetical protein
MNAIDRAESASQWWRWPLVPFAAFIGGMGAALLLGIFLWFGMKLNGGYTEDGWYYKYIMPVMTYSMFGYFYVYAAMYVAPRGKFITAVVMTTILGVFSVAAIVIAWAVWPESAAKSLQQTVGTIASMVAAVVAITKLRDEFRN